MTDLTHLNYDFMLGYIYPYRYLGDIYVNVEGHDNINRAYPPLNYQKDRIIHERYVIQKAGY